MAKIDLLSDALNFSEEEQPKKDSKIGETESPLTEEDFDFNIELDDSVVEEGPEAEPVAESEADEEEIKDVFESAQPAEETPIKKIKLDFKDEEEILDEELDSLVMSELQEEEPPAAKTHDEPVAAQLDTEPSEVQTEITEEKPRVQIPDDEENVVKPNPFYQGNQETETITEEYEYESFDEDIEREGGKSKRLIFLLILLAIVAGGGYYFLFMQKSPEVSETTATVESQGEVNNTQGTGAVNPDVIRKKQQLLSIWQQANARTNQFNLQLSSLTGLTTSTIYYTNLRDDGSKISLTVVAPDRDGLAGLNNRLRELPDVRKIRYLNVSEMNINKDIKLVADIELEAVKRPVPAGNINVDQFSAVKIQAFKQYFERSGIRSLKFDFNIVNANPTRPFKTYNCDVSGLVDYNTLKSIFSTLSERFPHAEIKKINIYSKGFSPLSKSSVQFYLNLVFHEANL